MTPTRGAELALGTVQFGLAYGLAGRAAPVAEPEVRAILARASAIGIERLDTAAAYGDIEERLGRLVGDLPFRVVSKIPALPGGIDVAEARAFACAMVERSHIRLGALLTGVLFHDAAAVKGEAGRAIWEAAAEACDRFGIALGVSGYSPQDAAALLGDLPLAMTQLPGSAFDQRLAPVVEAFAGVEVTLRSIFLQGLLLMPETEGARRLPVAAQALAEWHDWCRARGLAPLDGAIGVCKAMPGVRYCVVGVDDLAQFEQIAGAWGRAAAETAPELAQSALDIIDPRRWPRN